MFGFFRKKKFNYSLDEKRPASIRYALIENELYVDSDTHALVLPQNKEVPEPGIKLPANNCYSYLSVGLGKYNQQEIIFVLSTAMSQHLEAYQADIFKLFRFIHNQSKAGNTVSAGSYTTFLENGPFGKNNCGIAYLEAVADDSIEPKISANVLLAVYIHPEEIDSMVSSSPYRVAAWLAYNYRIFPYPKFSDPARQSVLPQGLSTTILLGGPKLIAVKEATACLEGVALFITIPPPIHNTLSANLEVIKQGQVFSMVTGHVVGANSRLVWLPDGPQSVGFPVDEQSRLEGGFVTFVGNQPVDKAILTEDGFGVFLCDKTWGRLCSIIENGSNSVLSFKENTAVISQMYIEFYDDGPYIRKLPEPEIAGETTKNVLKASVISENPADFIRNRISEIDANLSEQLNLIIHHQDFQCLERSWRGLKYLIANSEINELLKIKVFNISKKELWKNLKRHKGILNQSPLFKKLHDDEFGVFGGEPYGCLIADYYFDQRPNDIELLNQISTICAFIHVPFIAGASPALINCNMGSWKDFISDYATMKIHLAPEYAAWRNLREAPDSCYIYLTLPRFLGRKPYASDINQTLKFSLNEEVNEGENDNYCWVNASYAMACNINRSFSKYGWFSRIIGIEDGGYIEALPSTGNCDIEVAIGDRIGESLNKQGFISIVHKGGFSCFWSGTSICKSTNNDGADIDFSNFLTTRLRYILCISRFVHYLKCKNRDRFGAYKLTKDIEYMLNEWLADYVESDMDAPQFNTVRKPLVAGSVTLVSRKDAPEVIDVEFLVLPNYQIESLIPPVKVRFSIYNG